MQKTGEALGEIETRVLAINDHIHSIATAAAEQATGIREVNTAVNQMDQVTQQNAATVEQSTAASHTLAGEAEQLSKLIARFDLGGQTTRPAARQAPARSHAPVAALRTTGSRGGAALKPMAHADAEAGWDEF